MLRGPAEADVREDACLTSLRLSVSRASCDSLRTPHMAPSDESPGVSPALSAQLAASVAAQRQEGVMSSVPTRSHASTECVPPEATLSFQAKPVLHTKRLHHAVTDVVQPLSSAAPASI